MKETRAVVPVDPEKKTCEWLEPVFVFTISTAPYVPDPSLVTSEDDVSSVYLAFGRHCALVNSEWPRARGR